MTMYRDAVDAGAEWLTNVKADWWTLINRATLDIDDGNHCVLGQVFAAESDQGGFLSGYHFIQWVWSFSAQWEIEHGFLTIGNPLLLKEAWIEKLDEMEFVTS